MSSIARYDFENRSWHSDKPRYPNNKVDKELQSIFLPLNLLQILVLNPKFYIRKNLVKPNNRLQKLILMFGLVIFISGYVYRIAEIIFDDNLKRYGSINFLYYASYFDFIFYSSGFIMNVIIHCKQSRKMVTFVLIFQKIHVFINSGIRRCIIRNWTNVTLIISFYTLVMLFSSLNIYNQLSWYFTLNLLYLASLDSNIIYAISLIKLLADKLDIWSVHVLTPIKNYEKNATYRDQMLEAYKQILQCYDLWKDVFQQQVLYQTIETFCRCLINIQVMIEFRKIIMVRTPLVSILLYFWLVKTVFLQLTLSLHLEAFYEAVKHAQDCCSKILTSNYTAEQRKLCKNVQRLHKASYTKMSACGLFCVDISLLLRLLALITNYTVVLLQFAFL